MSRFKLSKWFQRGHKSEKEVLDTTPVAIPVGFHRPLTIQETIARYISSASAMAAANGAETFEEAEDFDVEDDYDPSSPWEREFDPVTGKEMYKQERAYMDSARQEFDRLYTEHKKANVGKSSKHAPKAKKKRQEVAEEEFDGED